VPLTSTVYVYSGGPTGASATPSATLQGPDSNAAFGRSLADVGDLDGDGREELAVMAPYSATGNHAYVFHATASGFTDPPEVRHGAGTIENFWVAGADVNGDGFSDFAFGNDFYFGSATGIGDVPSQTLSPPGRGPIATVGDLDADGFDDFALGIPTADCDIFTACGAVAVFRGTAAGLDPSFLWIQDPADSDSDQFGSVVAGAGDLDGDGYDDLVATSPYDAGLGYVALFPGSSTGVGTEPAQYLVGDSLNGVFGCSVY